MMVNHRVSEYPIDPIFLERWSPRAFTGEFMTQETLFTILEAARWAASSYNSQSWRFVYALRDTERWTTFVDLLVPFNQEWAKNASALVFAASKTTSRSPHTGKEYPSPTHSFDTGAACAYMMLQALKLGWHTHGIVGFDSERARNTLLVTDGLALEDAFAIGRRGEASQLSQHLESKEHPSSRMPLKEIAFEGHM